MTVSRVMNGENYVRAKTREQVLRTIREMEYLPNMAARSLAVAQNTRVALIYSNPSTAYLSELLVGVLAKPGKISAQLVIEKWGEIRPAAVRRFARSVAGVVLPPPLSESQMVLSELAAARTPAVAIAAGRIEARISTVRIDDFRAAGDMTAYLLSLGHRRIGFIKGAADQRASSERFAGFTSALQAAGLSVREEYVRQGCFTYRSGLEAAESLLSITPAPTAIFASNDDMAAAVMSVAHRRGLEVPRDLSIAGFDDTVTATTVWPELTTVRQPIADMAEAALNLLLRDIRRHRAGELVETLDRVFAHKLIKRRSTAPPARRSP
jgi:LacI family transcriptional regulator